ncbi:MAG: transcriptional repressor [Bacteroidales bacterium 36-12]|nr:MAG: transcriptional repressor [Bacteroidales bacterium 36-12]
MKTFGDIHRHLIQYSIRPSQQRTSVMGYLMNHKTHPTVDEIYNAISPDIPTLSKTTVYNTLNLFVEKGAALALTLDDKNVRYDANVSNHAHLICSRCGKVHDLFDLDSNLYKLPKMDGFTINAVEISYYGVCGACKES